MKSKIAIFSALLCVFGASSVLASDCFEKDCMVEPIKVKKPQPLPVEELLETTKQISARLEPLEKMYGIEYTAQPVSENMVAAKSISVKQTVTDNRAPLWDGTRGKYSTNAADKTVDWRDGVPIWDDSISNYKKKDFRDWFLEPSEIIYTGAADTSVLTQVEELLVPHKPKDSLWTTDKYVAQDLTCPVKEAFAITDTVTIIESSDGCPFETDAECAIWRRKPMVRETVAPRSNEIRTENMDAFLAALCANPGINATDTTAAPLLNRYQMLMKSANACCSDGMAYQLKNAGASDGLVYKFMSDDANFYQIGSRCLMMTDADLDKKFPNTATAAVAGDVRNGCLCRGRQWFSAMLAPFKTVYKTNPEFAKSKFNYTYTDGLGRLVTVSVNKDVQNVLNQLEMCP